MNISLFIIFAALAPIAFLITIIILKMVAKKELPDSYYRPFDHITGQASSPFHEEKEERITEDEQGDDKNKNNASKY